MAASSRQTVSWGIFLLAIAVAVAVFPHLVPNETSDRGIFLSVGARLLAGDTLYSGVYDNKDPVFYYLTALEVFAGRWSEIIVETGLLLVAGISTYQLARASAGRAAALALALVSAVVLTGGYYYFGYTELVGIALTMAAIASASRQRWLIAGALCGLLLFSKLTFVPVAGMGALVFLPGASAIGRKFGLLLAGGLSVVLALMAILQLRGELLPYFSMLIENIGYSQGSLLGGKTGLSAIRLRFDRVGGAGLLFTVLPIGVVLGLGLARPDLVSRRLAVATAVTLFASCAVLAVTGLWDQHAQILYIPALLALCSIGTLAERALDRFPILAPGPLLIAAIALAGGMTALQRYHDDLSSAGQRAEAMLAVPAETQRLLKAGVSGAYARLGQNDENGHAIGLDGWQLACARFHQYPFQSDAILSQTLNCAGTTPVLLVGESFAVAADDPSSWRAFVDAGEQMLSTQFVCDAPSGLRVCRSVQN